MCAVVGKAKNAFVVNISKDARVSALMDVIWNRGQGVNTVTMQFFLGKTVNNVWLDEATAASVMSNETSDQAVHGDPQGFVWMTPRWLLRLLTGRILTRVTATFTCWLRFQQLSQPGRSRNYKSMEDLWRLSELELEESA